MNQSRGFTLIEILVAISIIGLMLGLVLSAGAALQKNGRDAKRKSDLRSIQTALQQYYADSNFYPDASFVLTAGQPFIAGGKRYLNEIPKDPNAGSTIPYVYVPLKVDGSLDCNNSDLLTACVNYCLYAKLEFGKESFVSICNETRPEGYNLDLTQP